MQEIVDNRQFSAFFLWTGLTFYLSGCMIQGVEVGGMQKKRTGREHWYMTCSRCKKRRRNDEFSNNRWSICKKCEETQHEWSEERYRRDRALAFFRYNGLNKDMLTESEIKAKIMHIKLVGAIKAQKEVCQ